MWARPRLGRAHGRAEALAAAQAAVQERTHRQRTELMARRYRQRQVQREGDEFSSPSYMSPRDRRKLDLASRIHIAEGRREDYIQRFVARRPGPLEFEEVEAEMSAALDGKQRARKQQQQQRQAAEEAAEQARQQARDREAEAEAKAVAAAVAEAEAAAAAEAEAAEAAERRRLRELYHTRVPASLRDDLRRGAEYLLERTSSCSLMDES